MSWCFSSWPTFPIAGLLTTTGEYTCPNLRPKGKDVGIDDVGSVDESISEGGELGTTDG